MLRPKRIACYIHVTNAFCYSMYACMYICMWSHLCCELGIKLHLREYVLIVKADEKVEMLENSQVFLKCFKQLKLTSKLDEWKETVSQERIARAVSIDSSLSSSDLVNFHLIDSLVKFVLKARLQLLECNSLLRTYYPGI